MSKLTYLQAISAAMREEMERDEKVFLMGEDVAFNMLGTTAGFVEKFGRDRCAIPRSRRRDSSAPQPALPWSACAPLWT